MVDTEEKTLNDVLILGQAAPVQIRGGRKSICTAGWSPNEGMIRLYPVPTTTKARMWSKVDVPVMRNTQDVRYESWKIQGSKFEWNELNKKIVDKGRITKKSEKQKIMNKILSQHSYGCINELNEQKGSLGIIEPKILDSTFEDRKKFSETVQLTLDSEVKYMTSENYKKIPAIKYRCPNCTAKNGFHKQQVLAWEAYECMRKYPDNYEKLWENFRLYDDEYRLPRNHP